MKKTKMALFAVIIAHLSVLSSCKTPLDSLKNKYAIGTNINEVIIKQKDNDSFFEYENYCFWDEGKYSVSVHYDATSEIDSNLFAKKKIGTKKDLENIDSDDDIFDVVSNIGIPISCGTSGVESLIFNLEDADGCRIYFYNENSLLKVGYVEIL